LRGKITFKTLIFFFLLILSFLPFANLYSQQIDDEIVLAVAVHVSEYTKSQGLSLEKGSREDYPWQYFQIYTLLEEALLSDGTAFVEISDADIERGGLLTSKGNPKYPILISLAAECISDQEAAAISLYVKNGGFAYIGSSSWTRYPDGSFRSNFALQLEMGISSTIHGAPNWIMIGDQGARIRRISNHRLVDHLISNIPMRWAMPESYFDTYKFYANGSPTSHFAWSTYCITAEPLVMVEGDNIPFLAIKNSEKGWYIYHAEISPLAGWGEGNAVLLEYTFFRKAIEWAFESLKLPLARVAVWPYPYKSAFILRHDDISNPPLSAILEEEARGTTGQYFIVTDW